jgi:Tfp pilus assembly protein FimT
VGLFFGGAGMLAGIQRRPCRLSDDHRKRNSTTKPNGIAATNAVWIGFRGLKMKTTERNRNQGLTFIEALVLLAVLAVLIAFTSPVLRDHSARVAVKEATVQVALALHNAKNLARTHHTAVTVLFTTNRTHNAISFEFPDDSQGASDKLRLPAGVTLPDTVSVSSNARSLTFSPRGIANTAAVIELAASIGTDFFGKVKLNSVQSRIKTSYGLQGTEI